MIDDMDPSEKFETTKQDIFNSVVAELSSDYLLARVDGLVLAQYDLDYIASRIALRVAGEPDWGRGKDTAEPEQCI